MEIPLMLPDGGDAPDLINPIQSLANAVVRFALTWPANRAGYQASQNQGSRATISW